MNISYDYYRVFYYVAKYKKFTQASKVLLSNQPNITRTVRLLEDALGCSLFVRSNRGVTLTPEGEKLYAHVRIAFEHIESAEEEISLNKSLQSGIVSIGASEVALRSLLLPILKKYRTLYPGVRIHITNHSTPEAIAALENGLVDLAVVTTPTVKSAALTERRLKSFREVAVCSDRFARLLERKVTLKELAMYPIISLGAHTKTHEFYSEFFSEHGVAFAPDIEAATADHILPMIESDLGIGFIPIDFLKNMNSVNVIDLEEEIPVRHICTVKRRDRSLSIAAKELERLLNDSGTENGQ